MKLEFGLVDVTALLPGCGGREGLVSWAHGVAAPARDTAAPRTPHIAPRQSRRMDAGCRLAVEAGLAMLERHPSVGAIVCSSRHGELARNYRILHALAAGADVSPTDFAMSVHNAAAGSLTIAARAPVPASAVSAGGESFCQAFFEAQAFLSQGVAEVLLIHFETLLPDAYLPVIDAGSASASWARAAALVLTRGTGLVLEKCPALPAAAGQEPLPQDLAFLLAIVLGEGSFVLGEGEGAWLCSVDPGLSWSVNP